MSQDLATLTAPSFLTALLASCPELAQINLDALSGSSKPMPPTVVADKGKFIIKADGTETVITFPATMSNGEPHPAAGQPVGVLQAVVLKGKPGKEKSYYVNTYMPGQEAQAPDCWSEDGIKPDPSSKLKQCDSCAGCAQNAFGSGRKSDGSPSEGKACSDRKILAIFANGNVYRFAVPPASLSGKRPSGLGMAWDPYCNQLSTKGIPLPVVLTLISFDQGDTDYKLNFNFGGMLAEAQVNALVKMIDAPEVKDIILPRGASQAMLPAPAENKELPAPVADLDAARVKAETEKKEKAAATKAAKDKKDAEDKAKAAAAKAAPVDLGLGLELGTPVVAATAAGPSDDDLINSLGL